MEVLPLLGYDLLNALSFMLIIMLNVLIACDHRENVTYVRTVLQQGQVGLFTEGERGSVYLLPLGDHMRYASS